MYIITEKNNDVILMFTNKVEVDENKRHIYTDTTIFAYAPNEKPNIYEVAEIPVGVEIEKYCYTENDGFTKNPNYKEPEPPIEDQIAEIEEALCELAELIVGGNE